MSWKPSKEWIEESNVYNFMTQKSLDFNSFLEYSTTPEFWEYFANKIFNFHRKYAKVLDLSEGKQWPKWFVGGGLNVGNQLKESSEIFVKYMNEKGEKKELTYSQVLNQTKAVSSWLHKIGLKKGDRVAVYMPMIPEIVPIFLGIIRAGMIVVPLFSGFGKEPIKTRIDDSNAKLIFASDITIRKGKEIDMLQNIKDIQIEKVIVKRGHGREEKDYLDFSEVLKTPGDYVEDTSTEDPIMIIYTSGTTGKPKGCVHTHDGFPLKAAADLFFNFDSKEGETISWISDMGWMMGPWFLFGGMLLKNKIALFEGYPDQNTLSRFVDELKVNILGLSPSLIRALRAESEIYKLNLRIVGITGEPIDVESWKWSLKVTDSPIINYSGGTEISGGILGNYVIKEIRPSSFNGSCPGIKADVFDEEGKRANPNIVGELVVLSVWPGMTRGFWKNNERYIETYWSRWKDVWVHGDLAYYDEEGYYYIVGRSDDTIKVAGKRVGPAEVEAVINSYPGVIESACVGVPDPLKGEKIICFVVSKNNDENKILEYTQKMLGKAIAPSEIKIVKELPKTRNAKIMRRLIRAIILGKNLGDISSLENPSSIEEIKKTVQNI
ncbi:AMP-binding protein [Stygiolobus azoricus]|uniref:acetate--CoA ligase n=1 Tax=Stygiolobus azoricus TaxID=41675 RepID=A0A650CQL6_9CREN|nr:AMP-binding protein [Stygiolobus azoricus]QGR19767.1 AMP-binding protein [Stygiolobus azoricus]